MNEKPIGFYKNICAINTNVKVRVYVKQPIIKKKRKKINLKSYSRLNLSKYYTYIVIMSSSKHNLRDILDFSAFNNALRNSVPLAPIPSFAAAAPAPFAAPFVSGFPAFGDFSCGFPASSPFGGYFGGYGGFGGYGW